MWIKQDFAKGGCGNLRSVFGIRSFKDSSIFDNVDGGETDDCSDDKGDGMNVDDRMNGNMVHVSGKG
jgi:hypothetical protein